VNLGLVKKGELKDVKYEEKEKPIEHESKGILGKVSNVIEKILDCCRE
jgi:hypothetical protein